MPRPGSGKRWGVADFMVEGMSDAAWDEAIYYYVLVAHYRGKDISTIMAQAWAWRRYFVLSPPATGITTSA